MEPLPLAIQPDARFECHECGGCCRRVPGVILEEGDLEAIARHDWEAEDERFQDGLLDPGPDPQGATRLRTVEGQCVFLDSNNLCLVHRRLGADFKPLRCRAFPLRFASTPSGVQVSVSAACESLHRTWQSGPRILDGDRLQQLAEVAPRLMIVGERFQMRVGVEPSVLWDDVYAILEDVAGSAADGPLVELPWALSRPVRRALGEPPPPTPWVFEGPRDLPFRHCLDYLGARLSNPLREAGLGHLSSAMAELRRYDVWTKSAAALDAEGRGFVGLQVRSLCYELRPLQLGQIAGGLGALLYVVMATTVAAVRIAAIERRADSAGADDVNRVAVEAARLFEDTALTADLEEHLLAFERLIFDAPAPRAP